MKAYEVFGCKDAAEWYHLRHLGTMSDPAVFVDKHTKLKSAAAQLNIPPDVRLWAEVSHDFDRDDHDMVLQSLATGRLGEILQKKIDTNISQGLPPEMTYVRVDCANKYRGSPMVLECWPAGHYSPIHQHGDTTGMIEVLLGVLNVAVYNLDANGLPVIEAAVLSQAGDKMWLNKEHYQIHKVHSGVAEGASLSLHLYRNNDMTMRSVDHLAAGHGKGVETFPVFNGTTFEDHETISDITWEELLANPGPTAPGPAPIFAVTKRMESIRLRDFKTEPDPYSIKAIITDDFADEVKTFTSEAFDAFRQGKTALTCEQWCENPNVKGRGLSKELLQSLYRTFDLNNDNNLERSEVEDLVAFVLVISHSFYKLPGFENGEVPVEVVLRMVAARGFKHSLDVRHIPTNLRPMLLPYYPYKPVQPAASTAEYEGYMALYMHVITDPDNADAVKQNIAETKDLMAGK